MNETNVKQSDNRMGVESVKKLILTLGIPMIFSMIVQSLYNIIDSYFVAQIPDVADQAMNALTLAFPIQMLMIAVGVGTGVGVNALISRYLGQKDFEMVNKITGNAIFVGISTYAVFLIFGLIGFPAMGIRGAAYATVIGQVVTLALNMIFHYFCNHEIQNGLHYLEPKKDIILHIYQIGIPAIIMQALMSFMTYGVNIILAGIFALSPEIISICCTAMRVIAVGYLFAGVNIALQGIFQAMGKGMYSLIISLIRMVIVALPLAWLFVRFATNSSLTFLAFPIAELCGTIVAFLMYKKVKKEFRHQRNG